MSDVFISYSRLDRDFVGQLHEALAAQEQDVWIDWESIPPSRAWWSEIQKGIARANNFVVALSPNAMASPICHMEIEHARKLGKRIIPVLHLDYDRDESIASIGVRLADPDQEATRDLWGSRHPQGIFDANESELKHINYFQFRPADDFAARFAELVAIIRTDYEHKERHTTLELRASEWNRRGHDVSFLLLDVELSEAQAWLQDASRKEPAPTPLHLEYIQASEKRTRQLRNVRRTGYISASVAALAIMFAAFTVVSGIQVLRLASAARDREELANTQVALAVTARHQLQNQAGGSSAPTLPQTAFISDEAFVEQEMVIQFLDALFLLDADPAESLARLDALVARNPDRAAVYVLRGILYNHLGDYTLALADFDRAIDLKPDFADAYANRAVTHFFLQNLEAALADWAQSEGLVVTPTN